MNEEQFEEIMATLNAISRTLAVALGFAIGYGILAMIFSSRRDP